MTPGIVHRDLSRRERQILDILYRRGHATAADVQEALPEPPSCSAVRALLRILEEKGHVRHEQDRPRYVYRPTLAGEGIAERVAGGMVEGATGGIADGITQAIDEKVKPKIAAADTKTGRSIRGRSTRALKDGDARVRSQGRVVDRHPRPLRIADE